MMRAVSTFKDDRGGKVVQMQLRLVPARLPPASEIPPRPWLYGRYLLRGFITVLVAPGGIGKSQVAMGMAIALGCNRELLGHHIFHPVNSWVLNLEDPLDELDRRIFAMMLHHKIAREDLDGRLYLHSGRERALCLAQLDPDGATIIYPDKDALIAEARAGDVGLIVVDPYIRSHSLDENSNTQQAAAAAAWAEVAEALRAAVLLVHHTRKGAVLDIDAARGAKALTDHARVGLIVSAMSAEEAEELGVASDERWRYLRLDDAKANLAPKAVKADWFRMASVQLGNGTSDYPHGDTVTAIEPWEPPSVWESLPSSALNTTLDMIAAGPESGTRYAAHKRGENNSRWAGQVITDQLSVTEAQAKQVISSWLKNGLLVEEKYHDPVQRKKLTGLVVVDSKRPT